MSFRAADAALFKFINGHLAYPPLDPLMIFFTYFGLGVVLAGAGLGLVTLGFFLNRVDLRRAGYAGLAAISAIGIISPICKIIWHRPRPLLALYNVRIVDGPLFANSFPSGHTATAFAFAVAVSIMLPKSRRLLIPLACITGLSRIYLGVHYPLDVIFGAAIGTLAGAVIAGAIQRTSLAASPADI